MWRRPGAESAEGDRSWPKMDGTELCVGFTGTDPVPCSLGSGSDRWNRTVS